MRHFNQVTAELKIMMDESASHDHRVMIEGVLYALCTGRSNHELESVLFDDDVDLYFLTHELNEKWNGEGFINGASRFANSQDYSDMASW